MSQERIVERTDATGNVTERTVEREIGSSGGGFGATLAWLFLAAIVLVAGAYVVMGMNQSETKKDDAIAAAANEVGGAAKDAGDAIKKVGDKLGE